MGMNKVNPKDNILKQVLDHMNWVPEGLVPNTNV